MFRSLVTKNLVMVMTLSRLPMDEMSIEVRDQPRDRRTSLVVGEYKNILNARKWFKVCPKCPRLLREEKPYSHDY